MSDGIVLPTIFQAINQVMSAIGHVGKDGGGGKLGYKFRGIDAVINAVGPAFRAAGVFTMSEVLTYDYLTVKSNADKDLASVRLTVRYTFHGPAGDSLSSTVVAEAFDSGDKATAKAMSVALRTCLLQVLALPTDEPDPDEQVYERGGSRAPAVDLEAWKKQVGAAELLELGAAKAGLAALWNAANGRPEMLTPVAEAIERWKARAAHADEMAPVAAALVDAAEQEDGDPAGSAFLVDLGRAEKERDLLTIRQMIAKAQTMKRPDLRRQANDSLNGVKELLAAEAEG